MSRGIIVPFAARAVASILMSALLPGSAFAQDAPPADETRTTTAAPATVQWQPRTGDAWIDARLRDMGDYAARYRDAFVDEIVRYHEAPHELVEETLDAAAMRPGDVYFACALANATGRACRAVIDAWRADADAGWEAIAAQLDAAPDAAIRRRIRGDITESYVRWARPLDMGPTPRK